MNQLIIPGDNEITFDIEFIGKGIHQDVGESENWVINRQYETIDFDTVIDVEVEEVQINKADKIDYIVATSSGILTAALDVFWRGEFSLEKSREIGKKEVNAFVIIVAKLRGYNGEGIEGAIRHLEKMYKIPSDSLTAEFGGGLQHHLRDFEHHPSLLGLMFSILSQFTGKGYGTDTSGNFQSYDFNSSEYIGADLPEKIVQGVVTWAFHLISDMAGSSGFAGEGTGIPGPLLSFFKELSVLPGIKDITLKYKGKDLEIAKLISKIFNGTYLKAPGEKAVRFDFRTELGIATEISKQFVPVLLNECLVRSFYFIRKFFKELSETNGQLEFIDYKKILPYRDRELSRMLLVSSASFVTITTANAVAQSFIKNKGTNGKFYIDFLLSINYAGVGRFVFAIKADKKYLEEDFNDACNAFKKRLDEYKRESQFLKIASLSLNDDQARILYSLELEMLKCDLKNTAKEVEKSNKMLWLEEWKLTVINGLEIKQNGYFIEDQYHLYNNIANELDKSQDSRWIDLISLELAIFKPYYQLGQANDKYYKRLKYTGKYLEEDYYKIQSIVSKEDIDFMKKRFGKYEKTLQNNTAKIVGTIAATAVATAATGGLAWAFAPQIAIMIAGESVVGLSGAALTSASLALVGGGSLAAGGLGMAGGTSIIVGGGALLGAIGTGTLTQSTMMILSSKGNTLNETAKLLTYCQVVLHDKYQAFDELKKIKDQIQGTIEQIDEYKKMLKEDDVSDIKQINIFRSINSTKKYLARSNELLFKMINS